MLSQDDLTHALHDGLKQAEKCSDTFCRATATIENEGYLIAHNGTGSRDTDVQRIHATKTLGMSKDTLAERIKTWISGLHTGIKVDLNAAMATGGPVDAGSAYLVGERGPELFVPDAAGMIIPNTLVTRGLEVWCATCPPDPATGAGHWHTIETRGPAVPGWPWTPDLTVDVGRAG